MRPPRDPRAVTLALLVGGLAGCAVDDGRLPSGQKPQARPDRVAAAPAEEVQPAPSEASAALATYYARLERDLVRQGLLRTDGGGVDTPFTDSKLASDFEQIALGEEYERGAGLRPSSGELGRIKRWEQPVRVSAEFGASIDEAQERRDSVTLANYVDRLSRVADHPIAMSERNPNFHVLFMSEDDRPAAVARVQELVPQIDTASLNVLRTLPREIHCLVIAFSDGPGAYAYGKAVALIRAEHPRLLMQSCIHEEVAQGLGLANDSPQARPSIFNDDDEFALLTRHDELLLEILYDPRLRPGMSAPEAMPIVRVIASELTGDRIAAGPL